MCLQECLATICIQPILRKGFRGALPEREPRHWLRTNSRFHSPTWNRSQFLSGFLPIWHLKIAPGFTTELFVDQLALGAPATSLEGKREGGENVSQRVKLLEIK